MMTDAWTAVICIVVAIVGVLLYGIMVILTAKLAAYGWMRGKQMFNSQENQNGDNETKEETET